MDRCAILVDAGYVYASGGDLCLGTRSRAAMQLDVAQFVAHVANLARSSSGLPVLRTYWYDGAKRGVPTAEQQEVAALPSVKLRLGRINSQNQQKGVDALIYRDLMTLATQRAVADAFLISGDEDLREGVKAAQDMGVRVTLVGIEVSVSQRYNQSRELVEEADEVLCLTKADIEGAFSKAAAPPLPGDWSALDELDGERKGPHELGAEFAANWMAKATSADAASLLAGRPVIPRYVDIELLRSAERGLQRSLREDQATKQEVRRGFWDAAKTLGPEADGA